MRGGFSDFRFCRVEPHEGTGSHPQLIDNTAYMQYASTLTVGDGKKKHTHTHTDTHSKNLNPLSPQASQHEPRPPHDINYQCCRQSDLGSVAAHLS